jgi:hypothetical protein
LNGEETWLRHQNHFDDLAISPHVARMHDWPNENEKSTEEGAGKPAPPSSFYLLIYQPDVATSC